MSAPLTFTRSSRAEVLEPLLRDDRPLRLLIHPDGPARGLADVVELRLADGALIEARAGRRRGVDALVSLVLAESGTVEVFEDVPPTGRRERYAQYRGLRQQAEAIAAEVAHHLNFAGGLHGVLRTAVGLGPEHLGQLPAAGRQLLELVDGSRTVAQLMGDVAIAPLLASRIIRRLAEEGMVGPSGGIEVPTPLPEPLPEAPTTDLVIPAEEVGGEEVAEEIGAWLENESAPRGLASDAAFANTYAGPAPSQPVRQAPQREDSAAARMRQQMPITSRKPIDHSDDEVMREAGVGGGPNFKLIGALFAGAIALGIVLALWPSEPAHRSVDSGVAIAPPPPPAIVATASVATASVAEDPVADDSSVPPIAGPDAPEIVREAEGHLDAGRYRKASALLARLRAARPNDPTVWILTGQLYVDQGRLGAAATAANRAIKLDRSRYRAWVLKGSVLQFRNRRQQAKAAYERALKLNPDHPMSEEIRSVVTHL